MKDITIYTVDYCPYCKKAEMLLQEKRLKYKKIDITQNEEEYRKQGYAKKLINRCIEFGKSKNIKEFASDCEINNIDSYLFHLKLGFIEANRIICFTKKIDD